MKGCFTFLVILVIIAAFVQYWPIILIVLIAYIVYAYARNSKLKKSKYYNVNFDLMDGHQFEYFCSDLLRDNGFSGVKVTPGSGDHGIDIIAYRNGKKYAIQCKCYSNNVGNHAIQEAYSGMAIYGANVAVVMTNSHFTNQARSDARKLGVQLWDRNKIMDLIRSANGEEIVTQPAVSDIPTSPTSFTPKIPSSYQQVGIEHSIETTKTNQTEKGGIQLMYDKENGIFPAGQYLVGEDIDIGKYILTSRKDMIGSVSIYNNYSDYRKDEPTEYESFDSDFHLSLRENGMFIVVTNADMKRI